VQSNLAGGVGWGGGGGWPKRQGSGGSSGRQTGVEAKHASTEPPAGRICMLQLLA
jgi:hypothetical protein